MDKYENTLKQQRNTKLRDRRKRLRDAGVPAAVANVAVYWSDKKILDELGVDLDEKTG